MKTQTRAWTCEICQEMFTSAPKYAAHKRRRHPGWREFVPENVEKVEMRNRVNGVASEVHRCKHCSEEFLSRWKLREHQRLTHRKTYTRKTIPAVQTVVEKLAPAPEPMPARELTYCPCCGTNIKEVIKALERCSL